MGDLSSLGSGGDNDTRTPAEKLDDYMRVRVFDYNQRVQINLSCNRLKKCEQIHSYLSHGFVLSVYWMKADLDNVICRGLKVERKMKDDRYYSLNPTTVATINNELATFNCDAHAIYNKFQEKWAAYTQAFPRVVATSIPSFPRVLYALVGEYTFDKNLLL